MRLTHLIGYELSLSTKMVRHEIPGIDGSEVIPAHLSLNNICRSREQAMRSVNKFFDEVERNRKLLQ